MTATRQLLLFPFSGNAREAVAVIEARNAVAPAWDFLGFVDDDARTHGATFAGYPVLGGREVFAAHPGAMVLAVPGRPETFRNRPQIIASLGLPRQRLATLVHPTAALGPLVRLGVNTLVMAHVTLTAAVTVGDHVVMLPGTVVAHESVIGDYCLVGSNVSVSGGVRVGRCCYLGSGSRFIQEIVVGDAAMVGLGAVVVRDVLPETTVAGCPAGPIRGRDV
ncbi:MAG: acetyltransferase [Thermodesulfobacteriota bacterium]